MKIKIHPHSNISLIRCKDGSFIRQHWLYFRELLQLEIDITSNQTWAKHESWYNEQSRNILIESESNGSTVRLK